MKPAAFPLLRRVARGAVLSALLLALPVPSLHAHAGHDDAPGEDKAGAAGGLLLISAQARANLGLQSVGAEVRTLDKTFRSLGQIDTIPNRQAVVSSRIAGRVVALPFEPGQPVKKGQVVVEVESFQVGNPPPRARYEAPMDGVILARDVFLGSSVNPDSRILTVADTREVYAEARVFEGQVGQVRVGQQVRVRTTAFPGETFEGRVERLDAALDATTRTLRVWARLVNPDGKLRPNLQAEVTFVTEAADNVSAVPLAAVLTGEGGSRFVFVEQDAPAAAGRATNRREIPPAPPPSRFERREVVTGIADDRFVEIIEGVLPGDQVVVQGNYQLQYVKANGPSQPAAAPATANAKDPHGEPGAVKAAGGPDEPGHGEELRGLVTRPLGLGLGVALLLSLAANLAWWTRRRSNAAGATRPADAPVRPAPATPSPVREPAPARRD